MSKIVLTFLLEKRSVRHGRCDLKPDAVALRFWLVCFLSTLSERTLFVSVSMPVQWGVIASVLET